MISILGGITESNVGKIMLREVSYFVVFNKYCQGCQIIGDKMTGVHSTHRNIEKGLEMTGKEA
jgi:hypothetical protein